MINTLLQSWDLMRILRLVMALWLGYSAFADKQPLFGLIAAIFALQAIFNVGCCGANGCSPQKPTHTKQSVEEISYEDVK
ncbi:MAG: hypothetical protein ACK4GN_03525 [Runella sp.]